jgi:hypothetical protein
VIAEGPAHATEELGQIDIKGRVFMLGELRENEATAVAEDGRLRTERHASLDVRVDNARFGLKYQTPLAWLSGQLEADFAGRPEVKDAFARADWKRFRVQVGQFKVPCSAIELATSWELPTADREIVHDLMLDWLDLAGRRPGVALELRGERPWRPRITIGAFQGSVMRDLTPGSRDTTLVEGLSLDSQTLVARGQIEFGPLAVGAYYQDRVGSPDVFETGHFWTAGGDASLDYEYGSGALRLWADLTAGESWYEHSRKADDDESGTFVAARVIGGSRFGGMEQAEPYIEPFFSAAFFDPDAEVMADAVVEVANGVSAGFWDVARVSLQGQATVFGRNFPQSYYLRQLPSSLKALLLLAVVY